MHPASSVIIFNTFSGLGFGLLFWLGMGALVPTGMGAFIWFTIAYILAVGGLIASTFHLGHPERAIKAFSQWKTSWLSREGICAVFALITMALYGAGLVFAEARIPLIGIIGGIASLGVVFTTSMIYAQMKTVPRWRHWTTPAMYLLLSIGGGALLSGQVWIATVLLIVGAALQVFSWASGDTRFKASGTNMETATGLGHIGKVRAFEPPHTGTNYLMREFIHQVGRKHADQLRIITIGLAFVLPVILLIAIEVSSLSHALAIPALLSHVAGVLALRWLFFAQAEHVVGLYYGKR
ncbi:dimethyl sulfoxide reductase anchor subunit family protein [Roseobacter sp. CCS2]|uniref:dimethyl sulfoxide reductase anchor subunit family protein n=1 Tax=Roseobacter sp. CCS2 TaxID=391593 RepID=UPI0000F403F0|nr:DmsC/YnfH family molybdoenzyme membrane anchor subunit [Roseobacter sp. CCS2]EBA13168.1 anaerobic dimethyl sulfoxide reductase, C subunit, putative [Roseobacter sp. CCS2]